MVERAVYRLEHIKEAIADIRELLNGKSLSDVTSSSVMRAAFERFLERLSEASRHVPLEWKTRYGAAIAWPDIANIGNLLRHVYDRVDVAVLWSVYENDLSPLERAIDAMLAAHAPKGGLS